MSTKEYERPWMKLRAVAALGLPGEKLIRNWTDRGFISVADKNPGHRNLRLFSLANAVEISILHELAACSNPLPLAAKVASVAVGRAKALIEGTTPSGLPPVHTWPDWVDLKSDDAKPWFLYAVDTAGEIVGGHVFASDVSDTMLGNPRRDPAPEWREKRLLPMDQIISEVMCRYFEAMSHGTLRAINERYKA